jgi:hypothetical protein
MRFAISDDFSLDEVRVGNVYPVKGGRMSRFAVGMVCIAISEPRSAIDGRMCHMVTVSKDGEIVSTASYGLHAMEERMPIGFVRGLDTLEFNVEPI